MLVYRDALGGQAGRQECESEGILSECIDESPRPVGTALGVALGVASAVAGVPRRSGCWGGGGTAVGVLGTSNGCVEEAGL
eukprot:6195363-Pleurochrysis_carterae.AAC.3